MQRSRRRTKPEFWIVVAFVALLAYALIADWWKDNPVLGRVIVAVVIGVLVLCLVFVPRFRQWLVITVKGAFGRLVYQREDEDEPSVRSEAAQDTSRTATRPNLRSDEITLFTHMMGNRCENPTCRLPGDLEVHHIVPRREDGPHSVWNLLALCRNCHGKANKNYPSRGVQMRWAREGQHRKRRKELLRSGRWRHR